MRLVGGGGLARCAHRVPPPKIAALRGSPVRAPPERTHGARSSPGPAVNPRGSKRGRQRFGPGVRSVCASQSGGVGGHPKAKQSNPPPPPPRSAAAPRCPRPRSPLGSRAAARSAAKAGLEAALARSAGGGGEQPLPGGALPTPPPYTHTHTHTCCPSCPTAIALPALCCPFGVTAAPPPTPPRTQSHRAAPSSAAAVEDPERCLSSTPNTPPIEPRPPTPPSGTPPLRHRRDPKRHRDPTSRHSPLTPGQPPPRIPRSKRDPPATFPVHTALFHRHFPGDTGTPVPTSPVNTGTPRYDFSIPPPPYPRSGAALPVPFRYLSGAAALRRGSRSRHGVPLSARCDGAGRGVTHGGPEHGPGGGGSGGGAAVTHVGFH